MVFRRKGRLTDDRPKGKHGDKKAKRQKKYNEVARRQDELYYVACIIDYQEKVTEGVLTRSDVPYCRTGCDVCRAC